MGELQIIFSALTLMVIIGQGLLYLRKNGKGTIFIFNVILALIIAFISYSSFPSNYNTQRIIAGVLGALSLGALVLYYMKKDSMISRAILSVSEIGGLIYLFLGI